MVYAHPEKDIERAYGVWLRAPNRNARNNSGERWLRNTEGRNTWTEYGGNTSKTMTVTGSGNVQARFTETAGVVHENSGDNGTVVITPRNQDTTYKEKENSNLGGTLENENMLIDTKRKRMDVQTHKLGPGPTHMQLDGPQLNIGVNQTDSEEPKNLQGAGPGHQARLVL